MAESPSHPVSITSKPFLKRQLFTKPTWAQHDHSTSSTDFFRRSNQSYVTIAAEAERNRQRKLARKHRKQAPEDDDAKRTHKRQRTSSDSDSADDTDRSKSNGEGRSHTNPKRVTPPAPATQPTEKKRPTTLFNLESSPRSLSKRYESVTTAAKTKGSTKSLASTVIDLEGSDDDNLEVQPNEIVEVTATKRSEPVLDEDDFPPSDDEYAELARKAREKARRKRLEADIPRPASQGDRSNPAELMYESTPPPAAPDPVVSILITSSIPNTNPLIVNRKVSQRLKDVRLTWCQRQGFAPGFTEAVFLTWRGKRLFDVTTCRSLGIGVDSQGNIVTKGQKDILGEEERQIAMEAMTEEILEENQRTKRQEADKAVRNETEAHGENPTAAQKKEPQVRIILKAKGFDDFKLIVKPATPISRIVNAFKLDKKFDDCKEIFLSFDGDRLAPESRVADTELNDMDYIDVYVK
ncbi:MAG: hypothetical protein Q9209_006034 [Squamulea sp. 1 TL-2023]